jgi:hypothetical protein
MIKSLLYVGVTLLTVGVVLEPVADCADPSNGLLMLAPLMQNATPAPC